jgi:hypothetical protein
MVAIEVSQNTYFLVVIICYLIIRKKINLKGIFILIYLILFHIYNFRNQSPKSIFRYFQLTGFVADLTVDEARKLSGE